LYQLFASLLWYDPETDGYQTPNRYYIPRHGRWLMTDPITGDVSNPQSWNRYAYALNSPTDRTDPLGLENP
jgi:RHS repeat-associated protein